MSVAYGNFEDMAVHFLRRLAQMKKGHVVFFHDMTLNTYGVCDVPGLAKLMDEKGIGKVRPICCMVADEFMGLMVARYSDFFKEEVDGTEKTDLSAGQQPSSESAALDAGGDKAQAGGHGEDPGCQPKEDNDRTVH